MERNASEQFFAAMQTEIDRERAAVLGRYGQRVEDAIAKCEALLPAVGTGDERAIERYRGQRSLALQAIEKLCLQREMIGVLDHSWVQRAYPLPPRH